MTTGRWNRTLLGCAAVALAAGLASAPTAARAQLALPAPSGTPLSPDDEGDPVLRWSRPAPESATLGDLVRAAIARHPVIGEARARVAEAEGVRDEAHAQLFPTADIGIARTTPIVRSFDPLADTLYENSRALSRTDVTFSANQLLFDFGATSRRFRGATQAREAAREGLADAGNQLALRAIGAYYDVLTYRALVDLSQSYLARQTQLRTGVEQQITAGVSAPGDLAQVDAGLTNAQSQLLRYRRLAIDAEATYTEVFGGRPPETLGRIAVPGPASISEEAAVAAALRAPPVRAAEADARAARFQASAARRDMLPRLTAGLDAGRYRAFEDSDNYDIRAQVAITQRLGGGLGARAGQASARASGADFRLSRIRGEAQRDAEIAWGDVQTLQAQLAAARANYLANRQARDVLLERFRLTRGSLFNVLTVGDNFLASAAAYVTSVTALDTARYTLLARTGQLIPALALPSDTDKVPS